MNTRPEHMTAIVNALRRVHGDDIARVILNDGFSLATLIDAVLRSPATRSNGSRERLAPAISVAPSFGSPSPLKYFYDRPKWLHVVDIVVVTLHHAPLPSTDIGLRLIDS